MELGTYIHKLYKRGYDFSFQPNKKHERAYISPKDKIERKVIEYRILNN